MLWNGDRRTYYSQYYLVSLILVSLSIISFYLYVFNNYPKNLMLSINNLIKKKVENEREVLKPEQ